MALGAYVATEIEDCIFALVAQWLSGAVAQWRGGVVARARSLY